MSKQPHCAQYLWYDAITFCSTWSVLIFFTFHFVVNDVHQHLNTVSYSRFDIRTKLLLWYRKQWEKTKYVITIYTHHHITYLFTKQWTSTAVNLNSHWLIPTIGRPSTSLSHNFLQTDLSLFRMNYVYLI